MKSSAAATASRSLGARHTHARVEVLHHLLEVKRDQGLISSMMSTSASSCAARSWLASFEQAVDIVRAHPQHASRISD